MARRRYQRGSLALRGKVWYGRWWEDFFGPEGRHRKNVCVRLGTIEDFPTKKLATRELEQRLARVNSPLYRGVSTILFSQFVVSWQERVLPQMKPSTALNYRSIVRKHILPRFQNIQLAQLSPETVQEFVVCLGASPKTIRNVVNCLRSMWQTAEPGDTCITTRSGAYAYRRWLKLSNRTSHWKKSEKSLRHRQNLTGRSTGLLRKPGFVPVSCAACGGGTLGRTPCT